MEKLAIFITKEEKDGVTMVTIHSVGDEELKKEIYKGYLEELRRDL